MPNPEHLEILRHGVLAWNSWRSERRATNPLHFFPAPEEADFSGADLTGFRHLHKVNFLVRIFVAPILPASFCDLRTCGERFFVEQT